MKTLNVAYQVNLSNSSQMSCNKDITTFFLRILFGARHASPTDYRNVKAVALNISVVVFMGKAESETKVTQL
jgi:hypothetical protein